MIEFCGHIFHQISISRRTVDPREKFSWWNLILSDGHSTCLLRVLYRVYEFQTLHLVVSKFSHRGLIANINDKYRVFNSNNIAMK